MTADSDAPHLVSEKNPLPGDIVLRSPRAWAPHLWWIALLGGGGGAAFVWLATPHGREIQAAWQLGLKLLAFACLCCGIAFFPWASRRLYWLLYVPLVFFTGYVLPRISYFYYGDTARVQGDGFYTHLYLLLYPGIVLSVAAAYRLGGGSPGNCLKIAVNGVLIVFSGFLDIMWQLVNPIPIPERIDAPHIAVFTGGPISFGATILFALAHVPIVVGVALLPLDRWIDRLLGLASSARVR
ncbi:hypothetical protein Nocox_13605 [Nonomuraea coxensis DSM 45129]|uniref:Uncharacterized protein n=1 Tax=Nonomuraea coxensis DSM 45129 TaxID=1122611 RepID=A0ABX8TY81_9ACTN|nr:hypothetical protein Nocox_13605 [Nonomuraea coxensis DSM 45129]